jgi:hypothetical protein
VATADALADDLIATGSLDSAKILVDHRQPQPRHLVKKLEEARAIVDLPAGLQDGENGSFRRAWRPRFSRARGRRHPVCEFVGRAVVRRSGSRAQVGAKKRYDRSPVASDRRPARR